MDFEQSLNRLESIVTSMEGGQLSLEDSMKLFEEGVRLSRLCQEKLNEAEQKVQILLKIDEKGNAITEDFLENDSLPLSSAANSAATSGTSSGATE